MRIFFSILLLLLLTSCEFMNRERVRGNGNRVRRPIAAAGFDRVESHGSMVLRIKQQSGHAVEVETDENLLQHLDIRVDGNTLIVEPKGNVNLSPSKDLVVYIAAPLFKSLDVSGSGDLISENTLAGSQDLELKASGSGNIRLDVDLPELKAQASGSGNLDLRGEAERLDCRISGSGELRASGLRTQRAKVHVSGSGDASVHADRDLEVRASGSGSVVYRGNANVKSETSGSGSVRKEE